MKYLQVHFLAAVILLFYALGILAQPNQGAVAFITQRTGIATPVLAVLFVAGAALVMRGTSRSVRFGMMPVFIYAAYGMMLSFQSTNFNIGGYIGQLGFWGVTLLYIERCPNA